MTAIMKQIVLTAVGATLAGVVLAPSASATDYQLDTACDGSTTTTPVTPQHLCVHAVHNGHYVKSIAISTQDGMPGTLHVSWGDFHETVGNATRHQWDVEDRQGRARGDSAPLHHSDVVCGSLERLGMTVSKNVCVGL